MQSLKLKMYLIKKKFFRYPKWAQTFENQLSFEFKTKQSNALILYTDDSGIHSNFYSICLVDGRVQLNFR